VCKAYEVYEQRYRSAEKYNLEIQIDDYRSKADFRQEEQEKTKIAAFYDKKMQDELAGVKDWPCYVGVGIVAVGAFLAIYTQTYPLFVISGIGAAIAAGVLLGNTAKRKSIREKFANLIARKKAFVAALYAEHQRFMQMFGEYDKISVGVENKLEEL